MRKEIICIDKRVYLYGFTLWEILGLVCLSFFSLLELVLWHQYYFLIIEGVMFSLCFRFLANNENLLQYLRKVFDYYVLVAQRYDA